MGSDQECFAISGPRHIPSTEIDWSKEEHRRCITACLVKGTYVLESDRTRRRQGTPEALAPAWWESFHFRRRTDYELESECRCVFCTTSRRIFGSRGMWFIYGAVFQYAPPDGVPRHPSAPSYVVAFRGTTCAGTPPSCRICATTSASCSTCSTCATASATRVRRWGSF
ncbi:unnamed protein product [Urochloa humidicola]